MIWIEEGERGPEPVTLEEAKGFLRLDGAAEDGLVGTLVAAARESVEARTGLVLRRGAFRIAFEPRAGERVLRLSRRPVREVLAATAFDADGEPMAFAAGEFRVREDACRARIEMPAGFAGACANGGEIEVEAGLRAEEVPAPVRLAILRLVGASFEVRSAVPADGQPGVMPTHVRGLLEPYRRVGL